MLKEEKQTFFGSYADKDFTKKKTPVGIITALLAVAGIAGMITFGVINKGVVYNNGGTALNSEIFIETESKSTLINETAVRGVLDNIYTYDKDESKAKKLGDQVSDIVYKTREELDKDDKSITNTYSYYIVKLNNKLVNSTNAYYVELDEEGQEIGERIYVGEEFGLSGWINDQLFELDIEVTTDLKTVNVISTQQPETQ